jgi:superfamily II DNA/RNA helicase
VHTLAREGKEGKACLFYEPTKEHLMICAWVSEFSRRPDPKDQAPMARKSFDAKQREIQHRKRSSRSIESIDRGALET